MKKRITRLFAVCLAASVLLLGSCSKGEEKKENGADQSFLYGINYVDSQMSDRISVSQMAYLSSALGATSIRIPADCMETGTTFLAAAQSRLHELHSSLTLSGFDQIIFEIGTFPVDGVMGNTVPYPDLEDEEYLSFLDEVEEMAKLLAKEYSEVTYWQIGNQLNNDRFLHPIGWQEENSPVSPFTMEEKTALAVDIMYRTMQGVRAAGSDATVIMPGIYGQDGLGSDTMVSFLDGIYTNIKSGKHGSDKVKDFFDALAWHPSTDSEPDQAWVDANNKLYQVAEKNGDKKRKVYLTEFGFDCAEDEAKEAQQAEWITKAYNLVKSDLSYVESMHYYRLFNDGCEGYGLFHEPRDGFGPTAKGTAFQKLSGATADLSRYVIKEGQYMSGDNVALSVPTKASSSCEHPGWGWSLSGINNGTTETAGWSNYYELGEADWITSPTGGGSNDFNKPEWVEFNFPYSWEINKLLIYPRNEIDENFHQIMGLPRWIVVEVSDDAENWKQVGELKLTEVKTYPEDVDYVERSENPPLEISFDAVKTKNVRVTFKQLSLNWQHVEDQYFVQLYEIEILMK